MTFEQTDRDPCTACPHLITRPPRAPGCARDAHYGQTGCLRARPATRPDPPRHARR